MTYIIYQDNQLKEVDEAEYENWLSASADEFLLPVYKAETEKATYIIDTDYQGVFEDGQECCPFALYYIEDTDDEETSQEKTEYFNSFDELKEKRATLISAIEEVRVNTPLRWQQKN